MQRFSLNSIDIRTPADWTRTELPVSNAFIQPRPVIATQFHRVLWRCEVESAQELNLALPEGYGDIIISAASPLNLRFMEALHMLHFVTLT